MALSFLTLDDVDCSGKRVLLRGDLNVPFENGTVGDTTRLKRLTGTIRELRGKKARIIILSHFGRPKKGPEPEFSLKPVAEVLGRILGCAVGFCPHTVGPEAQVAVNRMQPGEVLVLENTRFHEGEEKNDPAFVKQLAVLGDVFVNDAFSVAHRAHASTEGLARGLPCCAGRDMEKELSALAKALDHPERPLMAIVGGSKISTKIDVLKNLTTKVDVLALGGGMANTFLAAQGKKLGRSLVESDMLDTARGIMAHSAKNNCRILLPEDVVVAEKLAAQVPTQTVAVDAIPDNLMALDIGPKSVAAIIKALETMKTAVWNGPLGAFEIHGPLGAFEIPPFEKATLDVARAMAARTKAGKLLSVAGGGDTVAVLNLAKVTEQLSYVSNAGGAFLEWLEGRELPGVEALRRRPEKKAVRP
ncbi:MAG: phosphoglycerate kinase [Proteobacteria bacterium]|nr:phosphoglycerate kinase [Pseudomonadota bacterium]